MPTGPRKPPLHRGPGPCVSVHCVVVLSVLVAVAWRVTPSLHGFEAEPLAWTAAWPACPLAPALDSLIRDTVNEPLPPTLENSQSLPLAPPEVWGVALCRHASMDCHLDLGLGSWPWQTLVLVTRPCSLQVEVFGKKVTGLMHPSPGHLELPTTTYIPEPTGTPSGAFRQVVSPLDCPLEKPSFPTTDSGRSTARTQAAPHPLPCPGHLCHLTGFAVLIDLGGIKDTARHWARNPACYIMRFAR